MQNSHSHLKEAVDHTEFVENRIIESKLYHPTRTALEYAPVHDPFEALEIFKEEVLSEDEPDEGDWKKSVNSRILTLERRLGDQPHWVKRTLDHMQSLVLWTYREDLENIRDELIKRANGIAHGLRKERRPA